MKKVVFLILIVSSTIFAQNKISKNLGDFTILKVYNGLEVELIKSDSQKIEITGKDSEKVIVKNVKDILKLYLTVTKSFEKEKSNIKVFYNKPIEVIDVNEGAIVKSKEVIEQTKITVKAQEGAKANLNISVKNLVVKSVTGSNITLQGIAKVEDINVNTGGVLFAVDLASEQATVTATTNGKAEVNVKDVLTAKTHLGGEIHYKGTPKVTTESNFMGGDIKPIK